MMEEIKQRKLLSFVCHGSVFFSLSIAPIGFPIVILVLSDDQIVKKNAKEAINLTINILLSCYFWAILFMVKSPFVAFDACLSSSYNLFLCFNILLFIITITWVHFIYILPIFAIIKVFKNPNQPFRYPCIIHFIR